jgi:hypothetical protein
VPVLAGAVRFRYLVERISSLDGKPKAPGFDQRSYSRKRVKGVALKTAAEAHPVLFGPVDVGECHHVLRAASEINQLGQYATSGDIERGVDAIGREGPDSSGHAFAISHGLCAKETKVAVVGGTSGADHARAAGHGELNGGAADSTRSAVDEQSDSKTDAELVQTARGCFECDGEAGSIDETEGQWDGRPIGQQRQFGRSGAIVGDTEYPVADCDICNTLSDLIDDARHVATRRLWQRRAEAQQTAAQLAICLIDAGRMHNDPNLSGTRIRIGKIHNLEDIGTSEPTELRCFHELLPGASLRNGSL